MTPQREREVEKAVLRIYRLPLDDQFLAYAAEGWTDEETAYATTFRRGVAAGERLSVKEEVA